MNFCIKHTDELSLFKKISSCDSLARSTLEGPVAVEAFLAVGLAARGALTVTDELQVDHQLLIKAQRFDFNDLIFRKTLLGFDGNLEVDLKIRGMFKSKSYL